MRSFVRNRLARSIVAIIATTQFSTAVSEQLRFAWEPSPGFGRKKAQTMQMLHSTMTAPRVGHRAVVLSNGNVLLGGGAYSNLGSTGELDVFLPKTERFREFKPPLRDPRSEASFTLLPTGEVLIAGGASDFESALSRVEILNVNLAQVRILEDLSTPRVGHSATLLPDGTVLVAGGTDGQSLLASIEIFDPKTSRFTKISERFQTARAFHTATLVNDRFVLFVGGETGATEENPDDSWKILDSAEVFDLTSRTFSFAKNTMSRVREFHQTTQLPDGRLLVTGGIEDWAKPTNAADIFDVTKMKFEAAPNMNQSRTMHSASPLRDGRVLICGGATLGGGPLQDCEFFNSQENTFSKGPTLSAPRWQHEAVVLQNGDVLITGGMSRTKAASTASSGPTNTAEIFRATSIEITTNH